MSTEQEITLFTIIKDKIGSTIHPQILQLVNIYLIQYINTGDRVKDGCYTIIVNALIALILSSIYYGWIELYKMVCGYFESSDYEMNVNEIMKIHKFDAVMQYKQVVDIKYTGFIVSDVLSYLIENKKINDIFCNDKVVYQPYKKNDTIDLRCIASDKDNIFIPVYKYFDNKTTKYEYIFLHTGRLVSKSFVELKDFVIIMENYIINKTNKASKDEYMTISEVTSDMSITYKGRIPKSITFNKIHFEEKSILLDWINKFTTNTLYPSDLCMSNKLGILLYGPPGTGKTGCISALANMLHRDIILVNSLMVCDASKQKLEDIIVLNKKTSIFVFDEFDYLLSSETTNKQNDKISYNELLLCAEGDERKKIIETIKENRTNSGKVIDQAFILKLLDGIGDMDGRIIIATTNNPEKINKIFLRPGRFDLKLKLGYCNFDMFKNIVKTKFKDETIEETLQIQNILKKNITPLMLINSIIGAVSYNELLETLDKMDKQEYMNCLQK
jgi:ATP-dependent 26S proteasome regulatory subunit